MCNLEFSIREKQLHNLTSEFVTMKSIIRRQPKHKEQFFQPKLNILHSKIQQLHT